MVLCEMLLQYVRWWRTLIWDGSCAVSGYETGWSGGGGESDRGGGGAEWDGGGPIS